MSQVRILSFRPSRDSCHTVIKSLFPFRSDSSLRCLLSQTESCFAFGECFIPTIKGFLSHSDQESFSFQVRFQSSTFASQTESCFAFGECFIPTIKGLLSHSDQESFSFQVRFQSSMFAFANQILFRLWRMFHSDKAKKRGPVSLRSSPHFSLY